MNLLFIIIATIGTGFACLAPLSPDWLRVTAFGLWLYLATDFIIYQFTGRTLYQHLLNR